MSPLSSVNPPPFGFNPEPVSLPLRPVTLIRVPTGPGVDANYLEAVRPGARVLALALGSGAHTVAVGFAILPPSAVGPPIIKVESTARHSELEGKCDSVACSDVPILRIAVKSDVRLTV